MIDAERATALQIEGLERRYGGLMAVNGLSFSVWSGEIFGIIGPNGAGKTTLFDLIGGATQATGGTVRAFGVELNRLSAYRRSRLGLARTFQNSQVFNGLDVRSNIEVAYMGKRPGLKAWFDRPSSRSVRFTATRTLNEWGLLSQAGRLAGEITAFERQRLAIAMAVVSSTRILLLDEPSGGLTEAEIVQLQDLIYGLSVSGLTIVIVDHRMRLIMELCDRILVLAAGRKVTIDTPQGVATNEEVRALYFGSDRHMKSFGGEL